MKKGIVSNDLRIVTEQLKDCESTIEMLKISFIDGMKTSYSLDDKTIENISKMTDEDIEAVTEDNVDGIVTFMEGYEEDVAECAEEKGLSIIGYKLNVFKEICESYKNIKDLEAEADKIREEKKQFENNYFEYIRSDEYIQRRKERIEKLKEKMEAEEDPIKKNHIKEALDMYNAMDSLSFLFTRIGACTDNSKEIQSLMESFFSTDKGGYVMEKFMKKCRKTGISPKFYEACLNLEENFLPPEYLPFNNFFLFSVMRFVAYIDINNYRQKAYASKIISNLLLLFSHRFNKPEDEMDFINVVKRFEDYLMPYIDEFKERNITWKEHPVRIKRDEEVKKIREEMEKQKQEDEAKAEIPTGAEVDSVVKPAEEVKEEASQTAEQDSGVKEE